MRCAKGRKHQHLPTFTKGATFLIFQMPCLNLWYWSFRGAPANRSCSAYVRHMPGICPINANTGHVYAWHMPTTHALALLHLLINRHMPGICPC